MWLDFPILYCIDENNTYTLDEEQLSIARINWRSIGRISDLQIIKNNLEFEIQQFTICSPKSL